MITAITVIFILGYAAIAFEHPLKLNKTAPALLTGVICWAIYAFSADHHAVNESLAHHLSDISGIIFFLLGAMTIVELIDAHDGFAIISDRIRTSNPIRVLWIVSWLAFILATVLDNLAAAIVVVTLMRKLVQEPERRRLYAGIIILAANAGGLWSPIGSITTTMLWIGGQLSALNIVKEMIVPSFINLLVPLFIISAFMRKQFSAKEISASENIPETAGRSDKSMIMLLVGILALLLVPVFKTYTGLPPYVGMLFSLGLVWVFSEILHKDKDEEEKKPLTVAHALSRIDSTSVLFFLGILLSVSALETTGILGHTAEWLDKSIGSMELITLVIGLASAIVDNVPLVAACMGMYGPDLYPQDHTLWELLAYTAGTGGSILIIGSAAGVAVMGMEKLSFTWYLKKISLLALTGYFAGAAYYIMVH